MPAVLSGLDIAVRCGANLQRAGAVDEDGQAEGAYQILVAHWQQKKPTANRTAVGAFIRSAMCAQSGRLCAVEATSLMWRSAGEEFLGHDYEGHWRVAGQANGY